MPSENQVFKIRDRLVQHLTPYVGGNLVSQEFEDFVAEVIAHLPPKAATNAVFHSARYLSGKILQLGELRDFCWRLAGNIPRLAAGESVLPWVGQGGNELVPVQIMDYGYTRTRKGAPAAKYKLRILAGSACPMIVYKVWQVRFVGFLAHAIFGFSRPRGDDAPRFPYQDPSELVRLRFQAELDPSHCWDGLPGFEKVNKSAATLAWNKKILLARAHQEPPCPENFQHSCFRCPLGYDVCMAGTHPRSYIRKTCDSCKVARYHDPADKAGLCVVCSRPKLVSV